MHALRSTRHDHGNWKPLCTRDADAAVIPLLTACMQSFYGCDFAGPNVESRQEAFTDFIGAV